MFFKRANCIKVYIDKNDSVKLDVEYESIEKLVPMFLILINTFKNAGMTEEYTNQLVSYVFNNDIDKLKIK